LDVDPGMLNCAPFKKTSGATETAPSSGPGDGVVEAGSTASSSARVATLILLVLLLPSRWLVSVLGGWSGIPGNKAFASLNFVGPGDLITTTSCRHSVSRGRGMMRPGVTDEREERVRREQGEGGGTRNEERDPGKLRRLINKDGSMYVNTPLLQMRTPSRLRKCPTCEFLQQSHSHLPTLSE
jgi:hypothetical protein